MPRLTPRTPQSQSSPSSMPILTPSTKKPRQEPPTEESPTTITCSTYTFPVDSIPEPEREKLKNNLKIDTEARKPIWMAEYSDVCEQVGYRFSAKAYNGIINVLSRAYRKSRADRDIPAVAYIAIFVILTLRTKMSSRPNSARRSELSARNSWA